MCALPYARDGRRRYDAYTRVHQQNSKACYSYCKVHGGCLAKSVNGTCISWACKEREDCSSPPLDFHVPNVAECLLTGMCRRLGCQCSPGFTGSDCQLPTYLCSAGTLPSADGCCDGAVSIDGRCCGSNALDSEGACCESGKVRLWQRRSSDGNSLSRGDYGQHEISVVRCLLIGGCVRSL